MNTKSEIYYKNTLIGIRQKNKSKILLNYKGDQYLAEFMLEKLEINDINKIDELKNNLWLWLTKLFSELKREFIQIIWTENKFPISWQKLIPFSIWFTKKEFKYVEILKKAYLWLYKHEYASQRKGERNIIVKEKSWRVLTNTNIKKSYAIISSWRWIWEIEDKIIILNHDIQSPIKRYPLLFNQLLKKQKWNKCNCCWNEFSIELLDIHHKYIPQSLMIINKMWNTELLCSSCHLKKHKQKYTLINLLIKISWYLKYK